MAMRSQLFRNLACGVGCTLVCVVAVAVSTADAKPAPANLSATQIVDRFIAARGGLVAWHAVQSMSWSGKLDAGTGDSAARSREFVKTMTVPVTKREAIAQMTAPVMNTGKAKQVELPFVIDMERPNKSRVEIQFAGKTAVQVYDGKNGWMVRPYLNRDDAEPFTPDEAKSQAGKWRLDGPLMDYAANGAKVALEGVEPVDGHDAYRIKLTAKDGHVQHFWIDTQSFLDVKVEGTPRRMDGRTRTVWVYQRDFRDVNGLKIPFQLVTAVDGYPDTHKLVIDKVALNPALNAALFEKPGV